MQSTIGNSWGKLCFPFNLKTSGKFWTAAIQTEYFIHEIFIQDNHLVSLNKK
jgi:hypothetical protein